MQCSGGQTSRGGDVFGNILLAVTEVVHLHGFCGSHVVVVVLLLAAILFEQVSLKCARVTRTSEQVLFSFQEVVHVIKMAVVIEQSVHHFLARLSRSRHELVRDSTLRLPLLHQRHFWSLTYHFRLGWELPSGNIHGLLDLLYKLFLLGGWSAS